MKGITMQVGGIVRKLRKENGMTLLELAEKSGVALATLSRIENAKMTGTVDSHAKICEALGVTLPELYKALPGCGKSAEFHAKKDKPGVFVHNRKISSEILIANSPAKKMMPILMKIAAGETAASEESKPGMEKFIYLLEGKLEVIVGEEKYSLTKGDTLYFAASLPHRFKNTASGDSRILVVTSQS